MKKKNLTVFSFFTLTASMLMSADEYPAFAESGLTVIFFLVFAGLIWFLPVALCSAEMATVEGWEEGGVFTWVKNTLGERFGFLAIASQWLQNTVNFVTMIYFIIGAFSYALDTPGLNQNPISKFILFMVIYWGLTLFQMGGIRKTGLIVKICFILGILIPSLILLLLSGGFLLSGQSPEISLSLSNLFPSLGNFSLSALVPFILAFAGIEASASYAVEMKNPKRDYPLAVLLLVVFAVLLDALGGLSVAIAVPAAELSLNSGVIQAIATIVTRISPALSWSVRIIALLLMFGMVGEVSSWIVGPVRTLYVAAEDGLLPSFFRHLNKGKVPNRLVILQGIIVSMIGLVLTVFLGGNDTAFKIAMSLTVMVYMITYILIFVGYLHLTLKQKSKRRAFQITRFTAVKLAVGAAGLISSVIVLISTLLPSQKSASPIVYILCMSAVFIGIIILIMSLYHFRSGRDKKRRAKPLARVRHLAAEEIDKFIFPKGRSSHWIE